MLTVGFAHGAKVRVQSGAKVFQIPVVSENSVSTPQFPHERMAVLKADNALGGLADMSDDVLALDRVVTNKLGHRGLGCREVVHIVPEPATFEERDAPAIAVMIGFPAPLRKTAEAERDVGGRVA